MYKKALLSIPLLFLLGACSSDEERNTATVTEEERISQNNSDSCHGTTLEGYAGPELVNIGTKMDKDEILEMINKGGRGMPAGIIKGEEAENVAAWLAEKK